jgi:hypothetical protein
MTEEKAEAVRQQSHATKHIGAGEDITHAAGAADSVRPDSLAAGPDRPEAHLGQGRWWCSSQLEDVQLWSQANDGGQRVRLLGRQVSGQRRRPLSVGGVLMASWFLWCSPSVDLIDATAETQLAI